MSYKNVSFNRTGGFNTFEVWTSRKNNKASNQRFILCTGNDQYGEIHDDFTPVDVPDEFNAFPQLGHQGQNLTVEEFVKTY